MSAGGGRRSRRAGGWESGRPGKSGRSAAGSFTFCDGSVKFLSENIPWNPAAVPTTGCNNVGDNPPGSGANYNLGGLGSGLIFQNLFNRSDGFPIRGEY